MRNCCFGAWAAALTGVFLLLAAGCGTREPLPGTPRPLSGDSLEILNDAIRRARPAFATQEEALRSGVYGNPSVLPVSSPKPPGGGNFAIEVAVFRDRQAAERFLHRVYELVPAHRASISRESRVYRVILTGWESRDAAGAERLKLAAVFPDARVRAAPSP